ncbi:response regulator [Nakamurella sp. YIM 132087]|uniref:Response regulator n=1 Tax=Nakamurella alba TaxID=2665158 RepID=A0A7K1FKY2_9ACTN|nr:response regulator [Nakamurella alba]
MITVLLVDDHPLVRAGLRSLLTTAGDIDVVGEASGGQEAGELAASVMPDVVLMDLSMPGMDGIAATRVVLDAHPAARVVVLTSFHDTGRVAEALRAGAVGYLLKDSEPSHLLSSIRSAAEGHAPLDPRMAVALLPAAVPAPAEQLSAREREVLTLIARGLSNRQIGRELGIAERTVKVHVGSLFRRIGVVDRTSAAMWARDHLPDAGRG